MGLISLTWVFCHNSIKIHLVVIEIMSFSYSVPLLVRQMATILQCQIAKKPIWLNAKIIKIQSWNNSTERCFPVLYVAIFSKGCHPDRSIHI